jgi:1,4-alpha-glucan branching enzyme
MPAKKRYISESAICKVIFSLPEEMEVQVAYVVGDFNQWQQQAAPMTQFENGNWKAQICLETGKEYRYRYLVNETQWITDREADKYVPNPYGQEDAVVIT